MVWASNSGSSLATRLAICSSTRFLLPFEILLFVFDQLTVEFVDQQVDGRVHVLMFRIGYDLATGDAQGSFDLLLQFLDLHDHLNIGDLVEMALQTAQFLADIVAQGVGHIQLMATDVDLHTAFSLLPVCKWQVSNLPPEHLGVDQRHTSRLRSLEGAMPRDSRYLATVRRAT